MFKKPNKKMDMLVADWLYIKMGYEQMIIHIF